MGFGRGNRNFRVQHSLPPPKGQHDRAWLFKRSVGFGSGDEKVHDVDEAILLADRILLMSNGNEKPEGYRPGGIAEVVVNPLPRERTRTSLHHLDGYYALRNHIVDFLVTRAKAH